MRCSSSLFILCATLSACSDTTGTGKVQVFAAAEDTIPDGLAPGTGEENVRDGWTVSYQKFLITIGNFRATRSSDGSDRLLEPKVHALDMKRLPTDRSEERRVGKECCR